MFHDQGGADGVQCEGTRHLRRIEFAPALFRALSLIMEKAGRVDNEAHISFASRKGRRVSKARLGQEVNCRRTAPAEADHPLKALGGAQAACQGAADAPASTEHDGNASGRERGTSTEGHVSRRR
jgi:hypothetical protein